MSLSAQGIDPKKCYTVFKQNNVAKDQILKKMGSFKPLASETGKHLSHLNSHHFRNLIIKKYCFFVSINNVTLSLAEE